MIRRDLPLGWPSLQAHPPEALGRVAIGPTPHHEGKNMVIIIINGNDDGKFTNEKSKKLMPLKHLVGYPKVLKVSLKHGCQ